MKVRCFRVNNKPRSTSTTGVKYLNVDYQKKFGHGYNVRVIVSGKHFVVWTGDEFDVGEKVAKKVQELMSKSKAEFLDWFDNDREEWLLKHGYKDADSERPRRRM